MSNEITGQALEPGQPTTIWTAGFISIFFTNLALNMGMFMSNSLLAVYARSMGASDTQVGLVMSTFAVASISFRMISAPIMDTYNRKYIVAIATSILACAFLGFSFAKDVPTLLVFRLFQGCGMAFGNACCLAIVAEMLPKDKYASGIGIYSLAQVMCQAIGPTVGLLIRDNFGYNTAYTINACIMLVATFLATRIKTNFVRTRKLRLTINNIIAKEALLPAAVMTIISAGTNAVGTFLIIFAEERNIANIGLYYTVTAVTMLATRPMIGRLTDKFGLVKIIIPALFCNIAMFFVISYSTSLWGFLLAGLLSAFGYGACQPAVMALAMKTVPNERRGAASSTNYIGMDLGSIFGPMISGPAAENFGYVVMWRVMTLPFVLGIAVMVVTRKIVTKIETDFQARQGT